MKYTTAYNPFEPISQEYDQWFDDNRNTFLSELEAVRYFIPKTGKGIEIGVGTGRFAHELGIKFGVEPSENMSKLATERGIKVFLGDAESLPYENESFDFAIMVAVDPFVNDIDKSYKEIFRILKHNRKLVIGTLHKEGEVARKYMSMIDSEVYKNANFHTIPETLAQLENVGFSSFNTCQTLLSAQPAEIEFPISGFDKGSFVAIEAIKS